MEYCVNCKHLDHSTMQCLSPQRPHDMVTGLQKKMTANNCRNLPISGCGEDAKWFAFVETEDLDNLSAIPFGR